MSDRNDRFVVLRDGRSLCYRVAGAGTPVLMIIGLGLHLTAWPEAMIAALAARGHQVVTFDNRDVGRSSRLAAAAPSRLRLFLRWARPCDYALDAMAEDAAELLDGLGISAAHVVGMSMGGMIGQVLAASHPDRVLSLTSLFSTTGARSVGQPAARMLLRMMRPPPRTRAAARARYLGTLRLIGGTGHPIDAEALGRYAEAAWDRGAPNPHEGVARQIMAILKSGDRTAQLRGIAAPTLVVHGDRDPMVHPSGGAATAEAIPGARRVVIPGMGHDLAPSVVPELVDLIARHVAGDRTRTAEAG
jgi:non-heme chloroperoxidase